MNDYPYIRAWGRMMGSRQSYVDDQVAIAKQDKAPHDATYKDYDNRWHTFGDIHNDNTRDVVANMVMADARPKP